MKIGTLFLDHAMEVTVESYGDKQQCLDCGQYKPYSEFPSTMMKGGVKYSTRCRECHQVFALDERLQDEEKAKALAVKQIAKRLQDDSLGFVDTQRAVSELMQQGAPGKNHKPGMEGWVEFFIEQLGKAAEADPGSRRVLEGAKMVIFQLPVANTDKSQPAMTDEEADEVLQRLARKKELEKHRPRLLEGPLDEEEASADSA